MTSKRVWTLAFDKYEELVGTEESLTSVDDLELVTVVDADLVRELVEALEEALDELRQYAQGERDKSFEGWQLNWREIEIRHESDYAFYPNHVERETIARLEKALAQVPDELRDTIRESKESK